MTSLSRVDLEQLRPVLTELGADAWLLWAFRGMNPVAERVLELSGLATRRLFVFLPREGEPVAVAHRIELQPLERFPGRVLAYARWQDLHQALGSLVAGRTVAMEVSEADAVPYMDRVPYGVVQLVQRLGGRVVSSAPLVSRFAARWSAEELADHLFAAEALAAIARAALSEAVCQADRGLTECGLQRRVVAAIEAQGLICDHPPIVAFGPNSANPHYEPVPGRDAVLEAGDVLLLDLWAGRRLGTVFADQTWMGFAGRPPARVQRVWETVRLARDAAIALIRGRWRAGEPVFGFEADHAAREEIERAGWGSAFPHRTGHSLDRDLHGSGPHLDDYESRDDRPLVAGIGFSVEPGVYLTGEFGIRSEVNVYMNDPEPRVTPESPQAGLIVPEEKS